MYVVLGLFRAKWWCQLSQLIRLWSSNLHSQNWETDVLVKYVQGGHRNDGDKVENINRGKTGLLAEGKLQLSYAGQATAHSPSCQ